MELEKNGIKIKAKTLHVGEDILLIISGGDKPHIGACKLNENTLTLPHHKDDIALNLIYKILKNQTKKNICLVGGIHVNNITQTQINDVLDMCKDLAKKLAQSL